VLLAGLTTGHKIGLAVVAAVFIVFALTSSFVVPRRHPDYPGRSGMSVFVIVSLVLFASMIAAVELFGAESESSAKRSQASVSATRGASATSSGRAFPTPASRGR
jgi:hypothetical protein